MKMTDTQFAKKEIQEQTLKIKEIIQQLEQLTANTAEIINPAYLQPAESLHFQLLEQVYELGDFLSIVQTREELSKNQEFNFLEFGGIYVG